MRVMLMSPSPLESKAISVCGWALVVSLVALLGLALAGTEGTPLAYVWAVVFTISIILFPSLMILCWLRASVSDGVLECRRLHTQAVALSHLRYARIRVRYFSLRTQGYAIRLSDTSGASLRVWVWALRTRPLMTEIERGVAASGITTDAMTSRILAVV